MVTIFVPATFLALFIEYLCTTKKSTLHKIMKGKIPISIRQDIVIWTCEVSMIWPLVGAILTLGLPAIFSTFLNSKLNDFPYFQFINYLPWLPLQIIVSLFLGDLMFYALHRYFHKNIACWQLHSYHHSASEMSIFTTTRDNPIVNPLWAIFLVLPSALFGSAAIASWVGFLTILHAFLIHSKIQHNWGFIGKYLLVSPGGHLIHHSLDEEHRDKNFAFLFPIIDHIFGTYYKGNKKVANIGIDRETYPSILKQIIHDDLKTIKILINK
jgi:sterol desaturase/sphingolipid hydroxylase (fatty acid hydroxylase superfamily)